MTPPLTHEAFVKELTAWVNSLVAAQGVTVDEDTRLFEGGLINSLRILEIIAWVERASGRQVTDRQIQMDNFASVRRMATVFAPSSADAQR